MNRRAEDRRLLTGEGRFTDDAAPEGAAHAFVVRLLHGDYGVDVHEVDERLYDFGGYGYAVGQRFYPRRADDGGFGAYAEYSRLAAANDVYFDVAALGV